MARRAIKVPFKLVFQAVILCERLQSTPLLGVYAQDSVMTSFMHCLYGEYCTLNIIAVFVLECKIFLSFADLTADVISYVDFMLHMDLNQKTTELMPGP